MAPPPHALVIPYPAQGHVIPLLEVAHELVDRGFTVTFANTEFNHRRVVAAVSESEPSSSKLRLVAVPDGMEPGEDRNDIVRLTLLMAEHTAPLVEDLIRRSAAGDGDDGGDADGGGPITCVVTDYNIGSWALDVARRTGVKSAVIWPASAAVLASILSIDKLVQDKIIDPEDGSALTEEPFQLSPDMPVMQTAHLAWNLIRNHDGQEALFRNIIAGVRAVDDCDFILCNSFHGAEPATFARFPKILPVGPLLTGERRRRDSESAPAPAPAPAVVGHFWRPEEDACMAWLDAQPARSVVYVAFGSFTMFSTRQFQELALGLELSGRPFLWVVRPDIVLGGGVHDYPAGFLDRVGAAASGGGRGKVVAWSPQQRVLAHPSVACFVTHCGWNSTMEGVRNGVPFLAWPYFADQFVNQVYICDVWKVGLRAVADDDESGSGGGGVVTKEHIAGRVEEIMGDAGMRERVEALKKVALESISRGGSSRRNFDMFVEAIKP